MSKLGRKRKDKDEYKPAVVSTRLEWEDYENLKRICETLNMTTSEYIRYLISKGQQPFINLQRIKEKCSGLKEIAKEINHIGNNINQIAKYVNSKKEIDIAVLEKLVRIEEELNQFLYLFNKWLEEEVNADTPSDR